MKKSIFYAFTLLLNLFFSVQAQVYNTIEVGQATLSAYSTATATTLTPFEDITFNAEFAPGTTPNVFVMTPEFGGAATGDDPCTIRIHSITNTGFKAVCLEPRNENRNSVAVTFDYIAIEDGTVDIPTTTAGSSVRFHSSCETVTTQQWGNNCSNCTGARSFQTVTFPAAPGGGPLFPATANIALLTQMTTINNVLAASTAMPATHPTGEPEFVDVSTTGITTTGFQTAIARMEAGNGAISQSEEICYLAVEDDGCKTLDLSGINGSLSTVNFEGIVGGDVVVGHDNGPVVAATFSSSCFSAPPISVASMRRRDGADGGFVRRTGITATNVSLIIDEDRISNAERSHITEPTSVLAFSSAFTTPVTLNYVNVEQRGRSVKFNWETSAESFHLGFHLWGETRDGWVQLNNSLIPGFGANTDSLERYKKTLRLSREHYNEVSRYGISSVDTSGYEEFYGPFDAGEEYGESDTREPIDWADTRKQFERSMKAKGYALVKGRWKKLKTKKQRKLAERIYAGALEVKFEGAGMRKVTGLSLLNAQPEWQGVDVDSIAVVLNGKAVERRIFSTDDTLSADDVIVFNVIKPNQDDALYLRDYTYRLQLDAQQVLNARHHSATANDRAVAVDVVYEEQLLTTDKHYSAAITSGNPWYDAQLFTTSGPVSVTYRAQLENALSTNQVAKLQVSLFGGIYFPGTQDDHHVQVAVNGHIVIDDWFDGLSAFNAEVELPAALLNDDNNEVTVTLPGDTGFVGDIVMVDEIRLFAPTDLTTAVATDFGDLGFEQPTLYFVKDPQTDQAETNQTVFAFSTAGGFSTVQSDKTDAGLTFLSVPFLSSVNKEATLRYAIVDVANLATPQYIEPVAQLASRLTDSVSSDLLMVAHPNFIGDELHAYIKFKQELGIDVSLVNWLDLVSRYGYGNNTPNSLDNYLASLEPSEVPKHILLVGGHTYDYKNILGQDAVSFIPAHYRRVNFFEYTPSDNVYADLNDDNVPELAIGRWPVRTSADLDAIIAKSIRWQELHGSKVLTNDVLLIAQANDGLNLNFENSLEGRVSSHLNRASGLANIERVYLRKLSSGTPVLEARDLISNAINNGTRLVSFAGHASSAAWGFQGIVNTSLIKALENEAAPTVVMPLACYTTNYEGLNTNSLAHQWLFAGTQGAAAVHGATSLGQYRDNGIVAERILKESSDGVTLGTAIMQAKNKMAPVNEMLHNWALLGDPTLPAP